MTKCYHVSRIRKVKLLIFRIKNGTSNAFLHFHDCGIVPERSYRLVMMHVLAGRGGKRGQVLRLGKGA